MVAARVHLTITHIPHGRGPGSAFLFDGPGLMRK